MFALGLCMFFIVSLELWRVDVYEGVGQKSSDTLSLGRAGVALRINDYLGLHYYLSA